MTETRNETPTLTVECSSDLQPENVNINIPVADNVHVNNEDVNERDDVVKFVKNVEEVTILRESPRNTNMNETDFQLFDLVEQQKSQIVEYQNVIEELESSSAIVMQNCKELEMKCEVAHKMKDSAIKEKESMVMRYAVSEKCVLQQQNAKEAAERKAKDLQREHDLLQHKLTMMTTEKARICQMLDNKCYELKSSQQESERLKTDLNALETKLKWSQNSLKNEIETRKDVEAKLEVVQNQIQDYVNEKEKVKKDCEDAIREFHTSQENRAFALDVSNKEQQASLILLRHELDDREQQVKATQIELDKVHKKHNDHILENNKLSMKVHKFEKERAEMEAKIVNLKNCADQQRQDAADLCATSGQLEELKLQLQNELEQLHAANDNIELLTARNCELTTDMEACRAHENELLSFTQQLIDKNAALQSEFTTIETKLQQLNYENGVLTRSLHETTTKMNVSTTQMLAERKQLQVELQRVQNELDLIKQQLETTSQELADQHGENFVIKRKHELSLREINKELAQCRKKLEHYESQSTASSSSSTTSLNTVERNGNVTPPAAHQQQPEQVKVIQPELELDRHVLIEHIAKLQRISAKKSEKIDFMEEHVRTLIGELQKKSRLLQHYIKREQQGTMSSNKMDNNKADLAKHTGIMASMYGAKIADENLTIEQVLDINRKLYAILEDALLKNITLKENIDTLGAEIEKLQKDKL